MAKDKNDDVGIVILAAGKGTRMKSDKAKVLHELLGRPMISYVIETSKRTNPANVVVVVGHQAEAVKGAIDSELGVEFAIQEKQLGTGHAVMCALPHLNQQSDKVLVLCGDTPLISSDTIVKLIKKINDDECDLSMLAVDMDCPTGYGRVIVDSAGHVSKIVEEADTTPVEKKIRTVNAGVYCFKKNYLEKSIVKIKSNNAQKEIYLTDIIEIANQDQKRIGLVTSSDKYEVIGINDMENLRIVEEIMKDRSRNSLTS